MQPSSPQEPATSHKEALKDDGEDFFLQVAYALAGCQLVEQELKLYISEALEYVRKCVGNRLPFRMSGQDYENSSLEGLVKVFSKLTDNTPLVEDINRFKKERNELSHRGITRSLDLMDEVGATSSAEAMPRLQTIQAEAERLRREIHQEGMAFKGHLYFGTFPE